VQKIKRESRSNAKKTKKRRRRITAPRGRPHAIVAQNLSPKEPIDVCGGSRNGRRSRNWARRVVENVSTVRNIWTGWYRGDSAWWGGQ